jgi:hypothetical protein
MPGDIVSVLRAFGLTNNTPLPISNALRSCLDPTVNFNRKLFVNGYQGLFDAIVQNENFRVITNAGVTSVKHGGNQNYLRIRFDNGGKYIFDKVIVATAPDQALNFIDDNIPMLSLLQQFSAPHLITVNAFETTPKTQGSTFPGTSPRVFNSVVYPVAFQLATATMPDAVIGMNKEFDDSGVVIAIGYSFGTSSSQDIKQRAMTSIQGFGYDTQGAVFSTQIAYPISVPASSTGAITNAPNGFFAQIDALQGNNGYYFVGESFAGYGIPPILAETIRVMSAQFLS